MREIRIYAPADAPYAPDETLTLDAEASAHLLKVLRLKAGTAISIFDGAGHEAQAVLIEDKKSAVVRIETLIERSAESPLHIELGQVISKGDRMEYILQKATELGVAAITPLTSERCAVKLDDKRQEKKIASWQKIVSGACEQCGRNVVPKVNPITDLKTWAEADPEAFSLILDPNSKDRLFDLNGAPGKIRLLTGPEGGLSESETAYLLDIGFAGVSLGPRILRTETAPIAALCILGAKFGDL